jgi:hypothetical protein
VQDAETISQYSSASVSASLLGIWGVETKVDYSMDIKTTTTMTRSIGFKYNMPLCDGSSCCVGLIDITPVIYYAADYDAPWISDDIRYFKKPKPWYLTYNIYPSNDCTAGGAYLDLVVAKAKVNLFLDRKNPERGRLSAKISLKGLPHEFSLATLADEQLFHLRLGNYVVNSDADLVLYRGFEGKDLVLILSEEGNSDSLITAKLSHKKGKSVLHIKLDADQVNLTNLYGYENLYADKPFTGNIPFRLFMSGEYHAEAALEAHCGGNRKNAVCNIHVKKN